MENAVSLNVGDPVPMSLGDCADALSEIRTLRLELEHKAEAVKKREDELQEHIITVIEQTPGTTGVVGQKVTAKVVPKRTPSIEDWQTFAAWILKTGQTQFLYRRVNEKAYTETAEANAPLPDGVGIIIKKKLSLTKA